MLLHLPHLPLPAIPLHHIIRQRHSHAPILIMKRLIQRRIIVITKRHRALKHHSGSYSPASATLRRFHLFQTFVYLLDGNHPNSVSPPPQFFPFMSPTKPPKPSWVAYPLRPSQRVGRSLNTNPNHHPRSSPSALRLSLRLSLRLPLSLPLRLPLCRSLCLSLLFPPLRFFCHPGEGTCFLVAASKPANPSASPFSFLLAVAVLRHPDRSLSRAPARKAQWRDRGKPSTSPQRAETKLRTPKTKNGSHQAPVGFPPLLFLSSRPEQAARLARPALGKGPAFFLSQASPQIQLFAFLFSPRLCLPPSSRPELFARSSRERRSGGIVASRQPHHNPPRQNSEPQNKKREPPGSRHRNSQPC